MPDLVMTADHCVSHGKAIKVIAGAHDITTEEASQQIIRVTKRRYVRLGNDDVALIKQIFIAFTAKIFGWQDGEEQR
uniref:Peptidase S1 domain-containing protein n=1 Tax=Panagrolaimus davidi TaxID=227884 RepID=A0A914QPC5_9BILA